MIGAAMLAQTTANDTRRRGTSLEARVRNTQRVVGRDQLLDRLHNLRTIIPVMAQELASARRELAALRRENTRLLARLEERG